LKKRQGMQPTTTWVCSHVI